MHIQMAFHLLISDFDKNVRPVYLHFTTRDHYPIKDEHICKFYGTTHLTASSNCLCNMNESDNTLANSLHPGPIKPCRLMKIH